MAETRRIVDDAATADLSLIDLDRPRAGGRAAHDRPHCLAVEIIALRQVLNSDESHGNLCAGVRLLAVIRGTSRCARIARWKRVTRQWIVVAENCACGALLDALKCREQTNRSLRTV